MRECAPLFPTHYPLQSIFIENDYCCYTSNDLFILTTRKTSIDFRKPQRWMFVFRGSYQENETQTRLPPTIWAGCGNFTATLCVVLSDFLGLMCALCVSAARRSQSRTAVVENITSFWCHVRASLEIICGEEQTDRRKHSVGHGNFSRHFLFIVQHCHPICHILSKELQNDRQVVCRGKWGKTD